MIEKRLCEENLKEAFAVISEAMNKLCDTLESFVDEHKGSLKKLIEEYEGGCNEDDEDEKPDSPYIHSDRIHSSIIKAAFLCSTYKKPRDALGTYTIKTLASIAYRCQMSPSALQGLCPYNPAPMNRSC